MELSCGTVLWHCLVNVDQVDWHLGGSTSVALLFFTARQVKEDVLLQAQQHLDRVHRIRRRNLILRGRALQREGHATVMLDRIRMT